jgi:A/G-specific adenine glycosylase
MAQLFLEQGHFAMKIAKNLILSTERETTVRRADLPLCPNMHPVAERLITWFEKNGRELPWRDTKDPYRIWLSEIILQQTRVEQGLPYYLRFIEAFPDVKSLARADEQHVLRLWQGLGYYSRARNLHKTARIVSDEFAGVFPADFAALRSLPGIGDYTAAAIASFAFRLPHAVVDGNVFRFLSRLYGIATPIDTLAGKKEFQKVAQELIEGSRPDDFNQALMEFGALHCTPTQPRCADCIFRNTCVAACEDTVNTFPIKSKKQKVRDRYFNYLVVRDKQDFYLRRRTGKDIWKGLWEFPLIESDTKADLQWLLKEAAVIFDTRSAVFRPAVGTMVHQLSHQKLHAIFHEFRLGKRIRLPEEWHRVDAESLGRYPVPRLIERFLQEESD